MEQDTVSTYDSVIPKHEDQWVKIPDNQALAQLHGKFWGKNMQDEEMKWRKTQPEDGSMNIDIDESAEEGEEDEIGPGCYILSLGIPSIGCSKLWIRQDYIRLYDFCEWYLDSCRMSHRRPSVVITGQPGVGKTYWVHYALCRCLAEKKPVMWYRASTLFLFVKEGVYKAPPDFDPTSHETLVWTLMDTNEALDGVPTHLAGDETSHFIIFSTPPNPPLWRPIRKTTQCVICIMNPWTRKEITKAAVIHGLTDNDKRIHKMYDLFGPTPRICFDFVNDTHLFEEYEMNYNNALKSLSSVKLCKMVRNTQLHTMDTESHTLLLMKRMSKELRKPNSSLDDPRNTFLLQARVELVSPVVEMAVQVRLWEQSRAEQLELYRQLADDKTTRSIADLAFKALAHSRLREKIDLDLLPMIKREPEPSHGNGGNSSSVRPIDITPERSFVYKGSSPGQIEDKVYYIPESKSEVSFDSFIVANGNLYIFQCSMASDRPIQGRSFPFCSQDSFPPRNHWYFVLVVPDERGLENRFPKMRDSDLTELLDTKLFTAVLDLPVPDRITSSSRESFQCVVA